MIDFLLNTVGTFVSRELYPAAGGIDDTDEIPARISDTMRRLGVIGLVEEDVGLVDVLRVVEALAAGSAAVALLAVAPNAGTGEARDRTGLRGVRSGIGQGTDHQLLALAAGAAALGAATRALAETARYLSERKAFGQVLAEIPVLAATVRARNHDLDAARAVLWEAANESGLRGASSAARTAAGSAVATCFDAIQLHGGYGYTTEYQVERIARDCISLRALIAQLDSDTGFRAA